VHMALVISGVISLSLWGIEGSIIIIIAHGVCSSGIFTGANIIYERRGSRRYYFNMGYLNIIPLFSSFWFILLVANFGGPFTYNLLGEIILILNLYLLSPLAILGILLLSFFSAAYSLILYRSTQQGQLLSISKELNPLSINENLVLVSHCWPLIVLPVFLVNTF
jgi:NADH-ubiquinone oxidoreductase chain 4